MRRAPSSGRSTPAGPSKRGKSPDGAGSLRQLSAIEAATYFLIIALIGSASGPYSRKWMSRFETSPANARRRVSKVSNEPFTSESIRLSTKAVNVTRIETTSRTWSFVSLVRCCSPSRSCRYIPTPEAPSRRMKMIETSKPPCAIRGVSVLRAPIRCAADHASPALNGLLGLALSAVQAHATDGRGDHLGFRRVWVLASGFEPAADYLW